LNFILNIIVAALALVQNIPVSTAQTQTEKKIMVRDSDTKEPIPFSTLRGLNIRYGTYADSTGTFILNGDLVDSIYISSMGYVSKSISLKNLANNTVYLERYFAELKPVVIKPRKQLREDTLGILAGRKIASWTSGGFGDEFAQKILFADTTAIYKIKTIRIAAERFDATIPMVLHIYNVGTDGLPNQDILSKKIIITKNNFSKRKNEILIDITAENIFLNEGACFVGIEWLPVPTKGQRLASTALQLTDQESQRMTYTRAFFYGKDKWVSTLSMPAQLHPTNTIISVVVGVLQ
jgi:hypothetical protein